MSIYLQKLVADVVEWDDRGKYTDLMLVIFI